MIRGDKDIFTYPLRTCGARPPDSGGHCIPPESKQKTPLPESGAGEWYRDLLSVRDEDYFT